MTTAEPAEVDRDTEVVVIGAGPAGLTAAYELGKRGRASTVLEADDVVGGISRSAERDGWRFDIGGHRFFTKVQAVEDLWHEILPDEDFLLRPRMSRIYYNGKFFDYPLKASNALKNLGVLEAGRCVLSYAWARVRPPKDQTNFEGWVSARFGSRLYRTFFKTYTEKVWGVPATEIQADWAAQRIKNLSLASAVLNAVLPKRNQTEITTLIEEFQYPKYGPGMMWERCRELVEAQGSKVLMRTAATTVRHEAGHAVAVVADTEGVRTEYPCSHVVSSMPISTLLKVMDPPVPPEVQAAADGLAYRDFLTVALVMPEEAGFPDNWIYVHSPEVNVGRIQNFGSWSPYLVKDGRTCLGLEYFVFEGDRLWTMPDHELVELGKRELHKLGLADPAKVEAGYVVRCPKAYPVYDDTYKANVQVLRDWLEANAANVHPVGRNGMHKYNNQDHSMYTAMLTVENILGAHHDIWQVNVEAEYHEEKAAEGPEDGGTGRDAPVIPRAAMSAANEKRGRVGA
ncbi:MAG: NAD(P)/FAD-dependent oxidoreductase [Actinomycetota bacterium]|nr:NAD(P)/FAD-dependent oxidoreductase [Actinomycetota bacterium]PLS76204.1 MAG: FAD-dependent oxidoreductase [Actinomycetota bacterium]